MADGVRGRWRWSGPAFMAALGVAAAAPVGASAAPESAAAAATVAAPAARADEVSPSEAGAELENRLTIARFSAAPTPDADAMAAAAIRRAFAGQNLDDRSSGEASLPQSALSGEVGFVLADPAKGAILERRNADIQQIPASVAKAPTALYALDALGPDFTFKTRVLATGAVSGGVLNGDLYLVGGGDPALDGKDLNALVKQLKDKGVAKVNGRFVYDESAIAPVEAILPSQPAQARYNPGVSGLTLNFNQVRVEWQRQADGSHSFTTRASVRGLSVPTNRVRVEAAPHDTVEDGFEWRLEKPSSGKGEAVEAWRISSRFLGAKGGRWLPVRRPGAFAADAFREIAQTEGIVLPEGEPGVAPENGQELAVHESGRLEAILRGMLRFSTNLTAEVVGLTASRARGLQEMALERSGALMSAWADTRYGVRGVSPDSAKPTAFRNHSGLSMESRLSPRAMIAILIEASRSTAAYDQFFELLPRKRIRGLPKGAEVRAKSGTVHYGRGLAGYIECPGGKRLAFAYLHSDIKTRKKMDAKGGRAGFNTGGWLGRARSIEKKLLVRWTQSYC